MKLHKDGVTAGSGAVHTSTMGALWRHAPEAAGDLAEWILIPSGNGVPASSKRACMQVLILSDNC